MAIIYIMYNYNKFAWVEDKGLFTFYREQEQCQAKLNQLRTQKALKEAELLLSMKYHSNESKFMQRKKTNIIKIKSITNSHEQVYYKSVKAERHQFLQQNQVIEHHIQQSRSIKNNIFLLQLGFKKTRKNKNKIANFRQTNKRMRTEIQKSQLKYYKILQNGCKLYDNVQLSQFPFIQQEQQSDQSLPLLQAKRYLRKNVSNTLKKYTLKMNSISSQWVQRGSYEICMPDINKMRSCNQNYYQGNKEVGLSISPPLLFPVSDCYDAKGKFYTNIGNILPNRLKILQNGCNIYSKMKKKQNDFLLSQKLKKLKINNTLCQLHVAQLRGQKLTPIDYNNKVRIYSDMDT